MKIKTHFTTLHITKGLIIAICLSAFIYFDHFLRLNEYILYFINSILALVGLYCLLKSDTKTWFFSGFFMGIFWLWWLGVSFYYYGHSFLILPSIVLLGLLYGVLFALASFLATKVAQFIEQHFPLILQEYTIYFLKAFMLFLLNFIEPFGFNWFKLQLLFINTIFGIHLWQFGVILFLLALTLTLNKKYLLLLTLLLIDLKNPKILSPKTLQDIELVSTNIDVRQKWKRKNQKLYSKLVLWHIKDATKHNKKLIIFPESILPYFLNLDMQMVQNLQEFSKKITIVVGALYYKKANDYLNTAYIFQNGSYKIANKVVLVPFGEANPLPKWFGKWINKLFFDGSVDYHGAKEFTYINALNKRYKIAICYEGTSKKTYEDNPKFLIVISNNGWFKGSIEPALQKLLMKYFVKLHGTFIYHAINGSPSFIIMPYKD